MLLSLSPSLPPAASPLLGFLFVLPPSSDPGLTHPEEPENFAVFLSPLSPSTSSLLSSLSLSLLLSSLLFLPLHPVYLERAKEGSIKTVMAEGERRREQGRRRFSFFALCLVYRFFSPSIPPRPPVPTLSLSPSCSFPLSVSSPSDFPRYHPV